MSPVDLIWLFLPQELLPLLVIGMALLSVVGLVRPRRVLGLVVLILLLPIISMAVEEILAQLPWYVGVLLLVGLTTNVIRLVLQVFLGKEAAGHILGRAVVATFKGLCYLALLPFRGLFLLVRGVAATTAARAPRV